MSVYPIPTFLRNKAVVYDEHAPRAMIEAVNCGRKWRGMSTGLAVAWAGTFGSKQQAFVAAVEVGVPADRITIKE